MNINKLEEKLLNDEINKFESDIQEALNGFRDIFIKYFSGTINDHSNNKLSEEVNGYILNFPIVKSSYFAGYFVKVNNQVPRLPDQLKEILLDNATKKFFDKLDDIQNGIEEVKEIVDNIN